MQSRWIFFYGTFMNSEILAEYKVFPTKVLAARLNGFRLNIRPRVNLLRDEKSCVYGAIAALPSGEIEILYSFILENFGLKYFPEAVLAETLDGLFVPALCYIASEMKESPPAPDYIKQLAECVRQIKLPDWYAEYVESFGT